MIQIDIPELTKENGLPDGYEVVGYENKIPGKGRIYYCGRWQASTGGPVLAYPVAILRKIEPEVFYGEVDNDGGVSMYKTPSLNNSYQWDALANLSRNWEFNGFCRYENDEKLAETPFYNAGGMSGVLVRKYAKFTKKA